MKLLIVFLSYFTLCNSLIYSQQTDTLEVLFLQQKATKLYETFKYDSAAHYYFRVAEIYEQQRNWINSVKNYRLTANSFNLVNKSDTALYFIQKALNISNKYFLENTKNEAFEKADVFLTLGEVHEKLGNYQEELLYYVNALNLIIQTDSLSKIKEAKIWNNIGGAYYNQNQYNKAIEFYEKSLETLQLLQGNNHIDVAIPLSSLGTIYHKKGSYDKALKYFQKALELRIQALGENHPDVAITYNQIGLIFGSAYTGKGNYQIAHTYLKKSLHINLQTLGKDHPYLEPNYGCLGYIYFRMGDYDKALEYFQKVLLINMNGGSNQYLRKTYHYISSIHGKKGDYDKALEYSQKELKIGILVFGDDNPWLVQTYINIGTQYRNKGECNKALEYYTHALKIRINFTGKEEDDLVQNIYKNMGIIYSYKGDHNKALEYFTKALKISKHMFDEHHPKLADSYIKIADECNNKNDFKESLVYYQKALMTNLIDFDDTNIYHNPEHFNALSTLELLQALKGKAKALYFLYKIESESVKDIKASISTYELAFKLINEMRNNYSHESTKLLISEENKNYFAEAIHVALEFNNIDPSNENKERAFEYIEKSKSTTLSTYLNDLKLKQYSNIADSLLHKEKDITINRREYKIKIQQLRALNDGYDTLLVQNYQDSLLNYSRQYDNIINTLELNYPEYFALKYKQESAQIKDIQHELDTNTALINYFAGDTSLFICTITKEEYKIKSIKIDSLFNEKIIDYYIDIKSDFTEKELKSSSYFYGYLIEPIEEDLKNKDNLIIIPDGNLYYIPFETLCKNDTYTENLSAIDYLIKDYSVTYHHTATLWLNSKVKEQNKFATKDNFIGFAPVFGSKNNNGFIVSKDWIPDTTNTELASRSVSNNFTHFNSLPYSENEVETIVKLFTDKRKKAKGFFFKEANEENFKQNIQNYRYIHVASHSFTNDLYPNLSGIAFSQPDTSTIYKEDGILYAGETYNLNLPKADLITLSSCKSGLGKLIQGEGFLSLSRGFLYSGTPNIIFSLWNVKDEPTKDLMIDFYKQVLQGTSYASALREAKIHLIKNPKTASPKYWGAWILVGK
ncbi:MAG: tetratricopeptide repeat protein [Bacteroidales bacterium]|nr:tetratricopeptide repeat protein [Bacteroidales bacterium]